jgi:hypothetical protein
MVALSFGVIAVLGGAPSPAAAQKKPVAWPAQAAPLRLESPADIFQLTRIWDVHLTVAPEQWAAMEPKGGRDFGIGSLLGPGIVKAGDTNGDGALTRAELTALGGTWFDAWDKDKKGILNDDAVRDGLNDAISFDFGPPGGGDNGGLILQGPEGKRNGVAAAAGIEFVYVKADVTIGPKTVRDVAVRYKGNGTFMESRSTLKRSLKIDFGKFAKKQDLAGLGQLNLHNNVTDPTWMNDILTHKAFRDGGVPAPRTAFARVYVTVPGKYDRQFLGLYTIVEDVDKSFARANYRSDQGAIFKPVAPSLFTDLGDDWKKYRQTYDPKTTLTDAQKQRVIDFAKLVTHGSDSEFAARFPEFVDVDAFARYMAVLVFVTDLDGILGPGQNLYLHLDARTNRFSFIPWDYDHSFGQFTMRGTQQQRENLSIRRPWQGKNRFLERVFALPEFQKAYRGHLATFSKTLFAPTRYAHQVDAVAAVIRPVVRQESASKLARFDRAVNDGILEPSGFGGAPTKPIKPFVRVRARSIADQLAGRAQGEELGEFTLFGPPPGDAQGGPGGPPNGPKFGPGNFLNRPFIAALDTDHNGTLSRAELVDGFGGWFDAFRSAGAQTLTLEPLQAGLDKTITFGPPPGGPPGGGFDPAAMIGPPFLKLAGAGPKPTIAAFVAGWKKIAARWDSDHNGILTRAELIAGIDAGIDSPPGGFGPGGFLAPQLLKAMEASKDRIPVATFTATMARWSAGWDTDKNGVLTDREVGQGLMAVLPPPDFGPGGGF